VAHFRIGALGIHYGTITILSGEVIGRFTTASSAGTDFALMNSTTHGFEVWAGGVLVAAMGPTGLSGSMKLPNDTYLKGRNAGDDGDINIVKVNTDDELETSIVVNAIGGVRLANDDYLISRNNADDGDINIIKVNATDTLDISVALETTAALTTLAGILDADGLTGNIRIPNNDYLVGKNNADDGYLALMKVNASDVIEFGQAVTGTSFTATSITLTNAVTEFSTDTTMGGDSDSAIPTEKAVKKYVDDVITIAGAHVLDGVLHTVSGLTDGHFLKATGAATFAFEDHGLVASDVSAAPAGHVGSTGVAQHGLASGVASSNVAGFMSPTQLDKLAAIEALATVGATWDSNITNQPSTFTPTQHSITSGTYHSYSGNVGDVFQIGSGPAMEFSTLAASQIPDLSATYDAAGVAATVQDNLDDHEGAGGAVHAAATNGVNGFMTATQFTQLASVVSAAVRDGDFASDGLLARSGGAGSYGVVALGTYAITAKGVTNGDSHNHLGGDGGTVAFSSLGSKPTTLSGYGITDAAPSSHVGVGGSAQHALVTSSLAGFMSAAQRATLNDALVATGGHSGTFDTKGDWDLTFVNGKLTGATPS